MNTDIKDLKTCECVGAFGVQNKIEPSPKERKNAVKMRTSPIKSNQHQYDRY